MILLPPSSSTLCFLHETSFHSLSGWKHGTWHSLTKESLTFLTHSCNRWDLETNPSQQTRYTSPQAYFSPLCAEEDLRAADMWVRPCNLRNSHDVRYGIRKFRSNLLSLKIYWGKKGRQFSFCCSISLSLRSKKLGVDPKKKKKERERERHSDISTISFQHGRIPCKPPCDFPKRTL